MTKLLVLSQGDREKKGDTPRRPPLAPRGAPPPALPPPPCWPHSFLLPSPFFLIIFDPFTLFGHHPEQRFFASDVAPSSSHRLKSARDDSGKRGMGGGDPRGALWRGLWQRRRHPSVGFHLLADHSLCQALRVRRWAAQPRPLSFLL